MKRGKIIKTSKRSKNAYGTSQGSRDSRQNSQQNSHSKRSLVPRRLRAAGVALSVFTFTFLVTLLSVSHFAPAYDSSADNATYSTNITSSGSINLNVISTPDGTVEVGKDSLSISTTATNGYKLYISTASDAAGNGLYGSGGGSSSFISPSTGSASSPVALTTNTWGYRASRDNNTQAIDNVVINDSNKETAGFSAVPEYSAPNILYTNNTPTVAASNALDVYYGVNATTALPSGTYSNSVIYTAITDASSPQSDGITISPTSQEGLSAGNPVTITTPLYPGSNIDLSSLGISVNIGNSACTNISPSVSSSSGALQISCNTPAQTTSGTYDVKVNIAKYDSGRNFTLANGYEYKIGRIHYVANEPSGTVSGTMEDQTQVYMTSTTSAGSVDTTALSSSTTELTFYSPNWTLSGYGFKGWNTKADGTGTMFGPNQTISTTSGTLTPAMQTALTSADGLVLYAQWVASAGSMANFDCGTLNSGAVTARTYGSDTYAIAKLADGKCWMVENMRTASNAGTDKGTSWTTTYTDRQYNLLNVTGTAGASPTSNGDVGYQWKSYGGYYSWHSAINSSTAYSTQYSNPSTQGICPSGWRLPKSYDGSSSNTASSDFRNLNNILNGSWDTVSTAAASNAWRTYPNNFVFAGYWDSSSSGGRGTYGYYWSSTVLNSNFAYRLYFYSTGVDLANNGYKYRGRSVRCVTEETPTMQNFDPSSLSNVGDSTSRIDARDGKSYNVAKLADGKVWMTTNLNLAGGTTLTSSTSNVSSSYTLPASSTSGFSDNTTAYVYNDSTYGGYYSWVAATAGTSPSSGTASYDICPKNWRLPTQAEFSTLISNYSASSAGSKLTQSPVNMLYGGYYRNSSASNQGSDGYYWSSTAYSSTDAYGLRFYSSYASTINVGKRIGFSVRCVRK